MKACKWSGSLVDSINEALRRRIDRVRYHNGHLFVYARSSEPRGDAVTGRCGTHIFKTRGLNSDLYGLLSTRREAESRLSRPITDYNVEVIGKTAFRNGTWVVIPASKFKQVPPEVPYHIRNIDRNDTV